MIKVLILCTHRPGRSPSQRYRFEQYLPFLEENGFQFTFSYLLNEKEDARFYSAGNFISKVFILIKSILKRTKDVLRYKKFGIIFIQREASFFGTSIFEKLAFRSGAYVIFDFDDSIWLADTSPGNLKWEWVKQPKKFFKNISYAHCVLAGNQYLAEKAAAITKNTRIVPTTIDTDIHIPMHELRHKEVVCIGWSGSISTIKHFELVLAVLKKIKEKYKEKVRFKLLGDKNYKTGGLEIETLNWTAENEVIDLNSFDIGIMPLKDDEWANGKCGLKGLSYMACEIPSIMSHVGVNKTIVEHGVNGFLAGTEEEWFQCLCALIENKNLRLSLGKKGRETVIRDYSVETYKSTYLEVFKNAQHH